MAQRQRFRFITDAILACAFLTCFCFPQKLCANVFGYQTHFLSWESAQAPRRFRFLKTARPPSKRFHVEKRRVIRLAKTTITNRRPYQFASPVFSDGVIYVGADAGFIYAVDIDPLRKIWKFQTEGGVHAPAEISGGVVYVGDIEGFTYALDVATGELRWRVRLDDEIVAAPFVSGSIVYVVTLSGRVYALSATTGEEVWHTGTLEKGWGFSVRKMSQPRVHNHLLYVGTSTGLLMAFRLSDGSVAWVRQLGQRTEQVYDVDAAALVAGGHLYTASADGGLFSLDPDTGAIDFEHDVGGANDLLVDRGVLYATGSGVLSALSLKNGSLLWQQDFETPEISAPATGEEFVAVVTTKDSFYLLDRTTGDIGFKRYVRKGSLGDPLVIGNQLFFLTNTGRLFGFRVKEIPVKRKK